TELTSWRVAPRRESALEHGEAIRLRARRRRAFGAQFRDARFDLHLERLYLEQERLARLVLRERDVDCRIAANLERSGCRVAVHVERDAIRPGRHVWASKADVVRRNRQLHDRISAATTAASAAALCFPARSSAAATAATAASTTTTTATLLTSESADAGRRR